MSKRVPRFRTDEEADRFLERDLTDYIDRDFMQPMRFELKPKKSAISLRLSADLLSEVKSAAKRAGVPYQKFIRNAIEEAVHRAKRVPR
jgi:predicted DNA binding CopG/RHH family protein